MYDKISMYTAPSSNDITASARDAHPTTMIGNLDTAPLHNGARMSTGQADGEP